MFRHQASGKDAVTVSVSAATFWMNTFVVHAENAVPSSVASATANSNPASWFAPKPSVTVLFCVLRAVTVIVGASMTAADTLSTVPQSGG